MDLNILRPNAALLAVAVLLDFILGDPVYPAHPVRLMGNTLAFFEARLRQAGFDGRGGGTLLFLLLTAIWTTGCSALVWLVVTIAAPAGFVIHVYFLYSVIALRDLLRHGWAVEQAAGKGDLETARKAISQLVGRDTSRMDLAACRRAAIESISENLTDGFTSPLFWYLLGGLPGALLFKVVSTMDSMVGYKTPRYLHFGWCGAKLDDAMNWIPARLTWLLMAAVAGLIPKCSLRDAIRIGWTQHAILPGPNSGWSEAAAAGAIRRRLIGPIWANGELVTSVWLGDATHPPAGTRDDLLRASILVAASGFVTAAAAILLLWLVDLTRFVD